MTFGTHQARVDHDLFVQGWGYKHWCVGVNEIEQNNCAMFLPSFIAQRVGLHALMCEYKG